MIHSDRGISTYMTANSPTKQWSLEKMQDFLKHWKEKKKTPRILYPRKLYSKTKYISDNKIWDNSLPKDLRNIKGNSQAEGKLY